MMGVTEVLSITKCTVIEIKLTELKQVDEEEGYRIFGGCFPARLPGAICRIKYEGNFKTEILQPVRIRHAIKLIFCMHDYQISKEKESFDYILIYLK